MPFYIEPEVYMFKMGSAQQYYKRYYSYQGVPGLAYPAGYGHYY
jgi:hypothetical protein